MNFVLLLLIFPAFMEQLHGAEGGQDLQNHLEEILAKANAQISERGMDPTKVVLPPRSAQSETRSLEQLQNWQVAQERIEPYKDTILDAIATFKKRTADTLGAEKLFQTAREVQKALKRLFLSLKIVCKGKEGPLTDFDQSMTWYKQLLHSVYTYVRLIETPCYLPK